MPLWLDENNNQSISLSFIIFGNVCENRIQIGMNDYVFINRKLCVFLCK